MFGRKEFDEKKHPYRAKGNRSPKPYDRLSVVEVLEEVRKEQEEQMREDESFLCDVFQEDWLDVPDWME